MAKTPPTLDMRLDGSFTAPRPTVVPVSAKLILGGIVLTIVAGTVAVAAFALWLLSMALPILVLGGVGAWAALRFSRWQAGRQTRPGALHRYR